MFIFSKRDNASNRAQSSTNTYSSVIAKCTVESSLIREVFITFLDEMGHRNRTIFHQIKLPELDDSVDLRINYRLARFK